MKYGFLKVAAGVPALKVADCQYNAQQIIALMQEAESQTCDVLTLPQLCISGSTCGDLFFQSSLLDDAGQALCRILEASEEMSLLTFVGMPLLIGQKLYNCSIAIQQGKILGIIPDAHPAQAQQRWFSQDFPYEEIELFDESIPCSPFLHIQMGEAGIALIFQHEDSLMQKAETLALSGANILIHQACQSDLQGKYQGIKRQMQSCSQTLHAASVYVSAGMGESSGDALYGGHALIVEEGEILSEAPAFQIDSQLIVSDINLSRLSAQRLRHSAFRQASITESLAISAESRADQEHLHRRLEKLPLVPKSAEEFEEIFNIQVCGLTRRMQHIGLPNLVIGISGGLDSTLSLLVAVKACDKLGLSREKVLGITMPGFGTSDRTYYNALHLMKALGISTREISIKQACEQHFSDIGHDASQHNIVYENAQARERTQILMDVANQVNGIVIGTGDLSELALGWATYNGDHMSMYSTNASISKTLVRELVAWIARSEMPEDCARLLVDIIDTPVSPELLPTDQSGKIAQKTEDLVGPYELHDFFLYHLLMDACPMDQLFFMAQESFRDNYDKDTILQWLKTFVRRFFTQQFKRACLPEGAQAGLLSLSPRGAWSMPSDAIYRAWMEDLENL